MADLPQHPGAGPRSIASSRARDAVFSSLSQELRWSIDEEDRFQLLEGAWRSLLGWRAEDLRGWGWEDIVHPADRRRASAVMARLRAGGGSEPDVEIRLAVATGGHRETSWTLVAGSGPDSILGLGCDRRDQPAVSADPALLQRRNAELAARLAELEERYTAVERFAGTAAHQLAEPLVIAESSAILVAEELGDDLDPMLRARLDAIGRSASRARRLMDALLAEARTSGRPLDLSAVDLRTVVDETLALLQSQVEQRRASVVVGPLPRVQGDPGLLAVVVENLLSNALKYGPRSDGAIEVAAERRADGWLVTVAGEGKPIPTDEAQRIFEPFHRAPSERRVPGAGLGLTICARLVERLGGTIGVEPGAERGNAFWITLRAAD